MATRFFILFTSLIFSNGSFSQSSALILNGILHIGNGETIPSAFISIKNGIISKVGNYLTTSYNKTEWDTIIDAKGKHIYPAFIAPNTTLGLTEIDAVRATRDYREVGFFNPHIRSQIAYNVESKVMSTVLTNGVLICQPTPRGGRVSGSSSVMKLYGWNWQDATILKDDGVHVNWPIVNWKRKEPSKNGLTKKYKQELSELESFFCLALNYSAKKNIDSTDIRLEAMKKCFNGDRRVYFHANEIQQLLDVISFVEKFKIKHPVIVGGYDAPIAGKRLKDAKIPVMIRRTHNLPDMSDDPVDYCFRLPSMLKKHGILFCLENSGDMEAMNARNIPFLAGTTTSYGLTEEEAIEAISLSTCKILGIDKKYGSIEKGKSATFFISDGNALDMRTNNVSTIFVDGKTVSTKNFQFNLYKKYKNKYQNQ
ncbi:MAG: amidohydrolase family protein [Crocinitomicaceae bacterium]|nr:amidohydrolase family protein [Crocinitomicaceae bacterium]